MAHFIEYRPNRDKPLILTKGKVTLYRVGGQYVTESGFIDGVTQLLADKDTSRQFYSPLSRILLSHEGKLKNNIPIDDFAVSTVNEALKQRDMYRKEVQLGVIYGLPPKDSVLIPGVVRWANYFVRGNFTSRMGITGDDVLKIKRDCGSLGVPFEKGRLLSIAEAETQRDPGFGTYIKNNGSALNYLEEYMAHVDAALFDIHGVIKLVPKKSESVL